MVKSFCYRQGLNHHHHHHHHHHHQTLEIYQKDEGVYNDDARHDDDDARADHHTRLLRPKFAHGTLEKYIIR